MKNIPIRIRMTLLNSALIALCCVLLSVILASSANRMADTIEASVITEALTLGEITPAMPTSPAITNEAAKSTYFQESILFTLFAVIIGGSLTYITSKHALSPLTELSNEIKAISNHKKDTQVHVPTSNDELATLALSFNEMITRLERSFDSQERFSYDVAHELRTPLTTLQTKLDVFRMKEQPDTEDYQKLLTDIEKQSTRLTHIIVDLLDMAALKTTSKSDMIDVSNLFLELSRDFESQTTIEVEVEDHLQPFSGNYDQIHRALSNLIDNGIKYGKSPIILKSYAVKSGIEIQVIDQGDGINPQFQETIFNAFTRVDPSRSRHYGGAGLGLTIVKEIVTLHNGTITLNSTNEGTIFTVTLPLN